MGIEIYATVICEDYDTMQRWSNLAVFDHWVDFGRIGCGDELRYDTETDQFYDDLTGGWSPNPVPTDPLTGSIVRSKQLDEMSL